MNARKMAAALLAALLLVTVCPLSAVAADEGDSKADQAEAYLYGQGVELDTDKALTLARQAASEGSAKAMWMMGRFYYNGDGIVDKDLDLAARWYEKALETDPQEARAMLWLGILYLDGAGVEQDPDKADELFTQAAALLEERQTEGTFSASDSYALSMLYMNGYGVEKDQEKAVELCLAAADDDYPEAQYSAGWVYYTGTGAEKDYEKALGYFTQAAEHGLHQAMYYLGQMNLYGEGVEENYAQAEKWFAEASKQEDNYALYALGWMYGGGHGVEKDLDKAAEYYAQSAELGNVQAQFVLGRMYYDGNEIGQDYEKARELFDKGAAQGEPYSQMYLADMYQHGLGMEVDYAKAMEYYALLQDNEDASDEVKGYAACMEGICYEYGLGVAVDKAKAFQCYQICDELDYGYGVTAMGRFYDGGYGVVDVDPAKAAEYYEKAIDLIEDPVAMLYVGLTYQAGAGVEKDQEKADGLFRRAFEIASEKDDYGDSEWVLGNLYYAGLGGVEADKEKCLEYMLQAAEDDIYEAEAFAGAMLLNDTDVEQDVEKGVELVTDAAAHGEPNALLYMGYMYEYGEFGAEKDTDMAVEYYTQAAALSNANAAQRLEELLAETQTDASAGTE